jgi:hypothetical protein
MKREPVFKGGRMDEDKEKGRVGDKERHLKSRNSETKSLQGFETEPPCFSKRWKGRRGDRENGRQGEISDCGRRQPRRTQSTRRTTCSESQGAGAAEEAKVSLKN